MILGGGESTFRSRVACYEDIVMKAGEVQDFLSDFDEANDMSEIAAFEKIYVDYSFIDEIVNSSFPDPNKRKDISQFNRL